MILSACNVLTELGSRGASNAKLAHIGWSLSAYQAVLLGIFLNRIATSVCSVTLQIQLATVVALIYRASLVPRGNLQVCNRTIQ